MTYLDLLKSAEDSLSAQILDWKTDGTLEKEFPELFRLGEYIHNPTHHPEGNPLQHTIEAVRIADILCLSPLEKIAVLFHDLGKGVTADRYDEETHPYHCFYGHEEKGSDVFDTLAERLEIPDYDRECIKFCIRNHMRVHKARELTRKKLKKLVLDKFWPTVKMVAYCDEACRRELFDKQRYWDTIEYADSVSLGEMEI